ncbi:RhuM family protein [Pleomorphomonas sp. PLEO]|uniref:RhuM family protein n=1 Tax=Pleomorphomonas sp. PLEO TaxID=3239306 RepID=UPI00351F5D31
MSDDQNEPVHLVEDESTGDRFLVYSTPKGLRLDVRFEGDTLWMTQAQISQLFGRDVSTISRHIANVIEEGELDEGSNLQKVQIAGSAKPVTLYSLDMVISVGYRVSSTQATLFRRWATGVLVQYARKGPDLKAIASAFSRRGVELVQFLHGLRHTGWPTKSPHFARRPIVPPRPFRPEILCLRRGGQPIGRRTPMGRRTPYEKARKPISLCFIYIILSSSAQAGDLGQDGAIGRYRAP